MTLNTMKDLVYAVFILACFFFGGKFLRWLGRNDKQHWRQHVTDNENSPFLHHPGHNGVIAKFRAQHKKRTEKDGLDYEYGFDKKGKPTRKIKHGAYKDQFSHLSKMKE
jgi:hypothetical protein